VTGHAESPGSRDLGRPELWQRSLERSRRRRERASARRSGVPQTATGRVSMALAAATLLTPVAAVLAPAASADLHRGSRGNEVAAVQRALGIPADGIFGPQTLQAVRAFQAAHGLLADGIVGPQTEAALGLSGAGGARIISVPAATAIAVQRALGVPADGIFGPVSQAALRAFQGAHGLVVDGVPGPASLAALGISTGTAPAPEGGGAAAVVAAARRELGAPYAYGGEGPAFDCSGLTQWAMRQAGISIPRTSYAQYGVGTPVSSRFIQPGDLVFFDTDGTGASHVGIATGPGTVISATTHGVMEHSIFGPYWGARYIGARRI
jgi:peptidoglycan DL-endopeptidase CwlO